MKAFPLAEYILYICTVYHYLYMYLILEPNYDGIMGGPSPFLKDGPNHLRGRAGPYPSKMATCLGSLISISD